MRVELTGRHVDITPALRRLVDRKLARLERVLNDSALSAQVVLTDEKRGRRADVTLHARGEKFLHGDGQAAAWEASLTQAFDKIAKQAQKVKGKWQEWKRRGVKGAPAAGEERVARYTAQTGEFVFPEVAPGKYQLLAYAAGTTTIGTVFPSIYTVDLPGSLNTMIVATKQKTQPENFAINLLSLSQDPNVHPLLISTMQMTFANMQPGYEKTTVFTDDHAPIEWGFFLAYCFGQYTLEGRLGRATIVFANPPSQLENLRGHQRLRTNDLQDGFELGPIRGFGQPGHAAQNFPRPKRHLHSGAHLHPPLQCRRY
jgi:putative sigma-54 modulation protein